LGISKQNDMWVLAPRPSTKNIIREKVVDPLIKAMVSFVNLCSFVVRPCTEKGSNYTLTNLLFGLCRYVWVINLLVNLPNPRPKISTHPSTPEVLWPRSVPQLFFFPLFSLLDLQLNPSKSLWVGHKQTTKFVLS